MEAPPPQNTPSPDARPTGDRRRLIVIGAIAVLALVAVFVAIALLRGGGEGLLAASAAEPVTFEGEAPGKAFHATTDVAITARVAPRPGATYTFAWGDGAAPTTGTNPYAGHYYRERGTYEVGVSVNGGPAATRELRVYDPPKPAIDVTLGAAGATLSGFGTNVIYVGDSVTFSAGRTSVDPDRRVVSYKWDFDRDNGLAVDAEGVEAATSFADAGAWVVRLTVTDDLGTQRYVDLVVVVGSVTKATGSVGTGVPPGTSRTFTDVLLDVDQSPRRGRAAVHVELVVTWTAGTVPQTSDLNLTLLDAAQKLVGAAAKQGEEMSVMLAYDVTQTDTRGVWTARLARDFPTEVLTTGVAAEDVAFELVARVVYG